MSDLEEYVLRLLLLGKSSGKDVQIFIQEKAYDGTDADSYQCEDITGELKRYLVTSLSKRSNS